MLSRLCRSGLCLLAVTSVAGRELQAQADSLYHPTAVDTITLSGPLVLGYFPPVTQAQVDSDESLASALSHVEFALDDARKCLPKDSVAVDLAFATTLVVLDGDQVVLDQLVIV